MEGEYEIKWESRSIPPAFKAWCEKHADRIAAVDFDSGYSHPDTGRECTAYNVLLRPGWCTEESGLHTIIEPAASVAKRLVREALPCDCEECSQGVAAPAQRGGARPGAGRKPLDAEGSVVTTIRLTPKQKETLAALGGAAWIREQLDRRARLIG